jgi:predicted ArsR family transcriptional regulator
MKTSRQRILDYILSHRYVTAADLSHALQMTKANARYHLAILRERGEIEEIGQRSQPGKGRPALLFGISERSLGDNLDILASALLEEVTNSQPDQERQKVLNRLASRLAERISNGEIQQKEGSLTQTLHRVVQYLNRHHYMARWEAHTDSPRLILEHCPYARIITRHPELCQTDVLMLEELLDAKADHIAKLAEDDRGARFCLFHISQSGRLENPASSNPTSS